MSSIKVLDQSVANMIAAGEVVENPASVVKELVENAIDAHSTSIIVEIQNGGITYIRVSDDGIGMEPQDASCAFLRHATSKISGASDLESIATLGFRGEALAAISAVSKIDLITKPHAAQFGTTLRVEAGKVVRESESGCPDGTTIIVRELFYNTPARMRFLKKDATEAGAVENVVKSIALSHPEVSIKLIKDGRDVLHTPGDGTIKSCMYALFGRDFANNMNSVEENLKGVSVKGFVCTPQSARGNRTLQFFFVNGRCVKSRMLSIALDNAYKERLMKGRPPTCVLELTLPLSQVDVNVHPAKTEVKFARERDVFDAVYFAARSALEKSEKRDIPAPQILKAEPVDNITKNQTRLDEIKPVETYAAEPAEEEKKSPMVPRPPLPSETELAKVKIKPDPEKPKGLVQFRSPLFSEKAKEPVISEAKEELPIICEEVPAVSEKKEEAEERKLRYIGEAMNTYIIVELDESVVLIDKHAAHERIIFEKLKATQGSVQSQLLLSPEIIELDKTVAAALCENREELSGLGFEIDEFGDGSIAVSAIPDGLDTEGAVAVLDELAENLKSGARVHTPDVMSETMYSVACKAAIKAGQKNSPEELLALAKRVVLHDDIRYCPHGRPVMIEYTKNELERLFKRIV